MTCRAQSTRLQLSPTHTALPVQRYANLARAVWRQKMLQWYISGAFLLMSRNSWSSPAGGREMVRVSEGDVVRIPGLATGLPFFFSAFLSCLFLFYPFRNRLWACYE